jgi:hypothetical protein
MKHSRVGLGPGLAPSNAQGPAVERVQLLTSRGSEVQTGGFSSLGLCISEMNETVLVIKVTVLDGQNSGPRTSAPPTPESNQATGLAVRIGSARPPRAQSPPRPQ